MATISITKTYLDGSLLSKADIDNIPNSVETFIETTKLNDDNIQDSGLEQESFAIDSLVDNNKLEILAGVIQIKEGAIDDVASSVLAQLVGSTGEIIPFHTYNGATSIPRGWMRCTGLVINETNYNAEHGAGAYAADGIASSPLLGKYAPDFTDRFARLAADTNSTGASSIPISSGTVNSVATSITHGHSIINPRQGNTDRIYNASGTATDVGAGFTSPGSGSLIGICVEPNQQSFDGLINFSLPDVRAESTNLGTVSTIPEYIPTLFIIKVR